MEQGQTYRPEVSTKIKGHWAIRIHLQLGKRIRDLALFNLAIDSKLRGCDLVDLRVRDIAHGNQIMSSRTLVGQLLVCGKSQPVVGWENPDIRRRA